MAVIKHLFTSGASGLISLEKFDLKLDPQRYQKSWRILNPFDTFSRSGPGTSVAAIYRYALFNVVNFELPCVVCRYHLITGYLDHTMQILPFYSEKSLGSNLRYF